jgi:hypothetical protein
LRFVRRLFEFIVVERVENINGALLPHVDSDPSAFVQTLRPSEVQKSIVEAVIAITIEADDIDELPSRRVGAVRVNNSPSRDIKDLPRLFFHFHISFSKFLLFI